MHAARSESLTLYRVFYVYCWQSWITCSGERAVKCLWTSIFLSFNSRKSRVQKSKPLNKSGPVRCLSKVRKYQSILIRECNMIQLQTGLPLVNEAEVVRKRTHSSYLSVLDIFDCPKRCSPNHEKPSGAKIISNIDADSSRKHLDRLKGFCT